MAVIFAPSEDRVTKREKWHENIAKRAALECYVLLENDGVLPLSKETKDLALYGMGARQTVKGGTGSGEVNTRSSHTIEDALREKYTITTDEWLNRNEKRYKEALDKYNEWVPKQAKKTGESEFFVRFSNPFCIPQGEPITEEDVTKSACDTAIYVIARISGEGADRKNERGDYELYEEEEKQIQFLSQHYKKVIVILNIGGIIDPSWLKGMYEEKKIHAILLMSQLGSAGTLTLPDVLSGKETPSGKLTDTWASKYADYPSSAHFSINDGNVDEENYTEGIYVGYRFFDAFNIRPVYPFGYGLSYTSFAITDSFLTCDGSLLQVSVTVANTGDTYSGREVIQLYVSPPKGELTKPVKELKAFCKTNLLPPGRSETYILEVDMTSLTSYSESKSAYVLEKETYGVFVGTDSANLTAVAGVCLDQDHEVIQCSNLFTKKSEFTELAPLWNEKTSNPEYPVVVGGVDAFIPTAVTKYQEKRPLYENTVSETICLDDIRRETHTAEQLVAQLSIEEMATLVVGTLRSGSSSVVGNASVTVPGAAGDTSNTLEETRGIRGLILADGPAGLRLQPVFKTDKDGKLIPGGNVFNGKVEPFPEDMDESKVDTYYQYCTDIPIEWALAQSWNLDLLEEVGVMIGEEMECFGVDLWLAPALNIHRNPLCGRNFEYYSEDPYVSGKAAAAITRGVQSVGGRGVVIKHFACNNQEENRYFNNVNISERTLREIFLKGFEIAVKESQPLSVMSSYNLIGGVHTANLKPLLCGVLRDEWGFQGMVMSDWFTSQDIETLTGNASTVYPISASTGCIYAGNDLQMPGCQKNVDDIVEAVTKGTKIDGYSITKADLQFCALHVVQAVLAATP